MNEEKLSDHQIRTMAWAIQSLSEGIQSRSAGLAVRHLNSASLRIKECFAEKTQWTDKEADASSATHTYLRKYDDSPLGTAIYLLWQEGYGPNAWRELSKIIAKKKFNRNWYVDSSYYPDSTEDSVMWNLIRSFDWEPVHLWVHQSA